MIPLTSITDVPIAMFVGQEDSLATPIDTRRVYNMVKTHFYYKVYPNMNHMSFTTGKNMDYFKDVLTLVAKYNPSST